MLLGGPLDLQRNELRNGVDGILATAPTSPNIAQFYFDSAIGCRRQWNGTAWINLDATKASNIPLSALAADPLARANHTGTQLAGTISNLQSVVQAYSLSSFAVPTANIPVGGFTLTGLPAPTGPGQPAEYSWTVSQIQSAAAGISSKDPVRAVATANVATLSGTQTVDGVALAAGDRVLLTAQTTASQNGPWVVSAGAWTRPATEGASVELDPGALWLVLAGTAGTGTQWRLGTTGTITPGTTALSIVQFGAGNAYTAGNGLTLSGNAFTVGAGNGILANVGSTAVDPAVVGRKFGPFTFTGDGTTNSLTVNHGLNNIAAAIFFYEVSSGDQYVPTISGRTAGALTAGFSPTPAASKQYGYFVLG